MENSNKKVITVAEDGLYKLTCTTDGFDYKPDTMRYVYGQSTRRPLEAWFLDELYFYPRPARRKLKTTRNKKLVLQKS